MKKPHQIKFARKNELIMNKQRILALENDADIGYGIQKIRKIFLYKREARKTKGSTCVFIASKSRSGVKGKDEV